MEEMFEKVRIRDFVQGVLGCGCPEEVFSFTDRVDNYTTSGGTVVRARLNIGNRLLVYVTEPGDGMDTPYIDNLLREGLKEREERGFNRFRLALLSGDEEGVLNMLREISGSADGKGSSLEHAEGFDDKVHAHILPPGAF